MIIKKTIMTTLMILQVWRDGLRLLTNNNKINNVSPMQNLKKHWMRLRYDDGNDDGNDDDDNKCL